MHIKDKLAEARTRGKPSFSFEFFPPKTAQGVQNLYDRMDRMHDLGPAFVDVTWGAGGRHSQLTCEMVSVAQSHYGLETCMHLTCTDMERGKVDEALKSAYKAGCTNILALRGDPPRESEKWQATEGGFRYAKDLVTYIKSRYGTHFDIGVAGYPEGCDDQDDPEMLIEHLKEKVDAGGTFVVTQMFYDVDIFLAWVQKCRDRGITVPIIPGIMPINTHQSFKRRADWTKCHVPEKWTAALDAVKNDDAAVQQVGKDLVAEMCRKILDSGITHLHFYTMNLAKATRMVLEELSLTPSAGSPIHKPLPWRQSLGLGRREEDVRPIFWRNRNASYIQRTQDWDEFPNGRWGDSRSPAFGELDAYGIGLKGTNEQNIKLWGSPRNLRDLASLFVRYKAYIELLVAPSLIETVLARIQANPDLTFYAVNKAGTLETNTRDEGPNAVTWGIFPNREIVQPTIVETVSFLAWKDEAYRLAEDWSKCYDAGSPSRKLIESIRDGWWLVNVVNNDFHEGKHIYDVFEDLEVEDLDEEVRVDLNGVSGEAEMTIVNRPTNSIEGHLTNGVSKGDKLSAGKTDFAQQQVSPMRN